MKSRILIIEDEPFTAAKLRQQVAELGYNPVGVTASGEDALRLAQDLQVDLALVDLRLEGEMDGINTAQLLRGRFSVESVFMSGGTEQALIDRAIEAKPYGYLAKPITIQQLKLSIEVALQRLHVEAALREREQQMENVLRTSMDSFWIFGLDGRVIDVNEAACAMTGFTREELMKKNLVELEYGRTTEQIAAGIEAVIKTGTAQIERLTRRKDGSIRLIDLSITCSPPPLRRLYCFGRDVTERRREENAVREREHHLRAIIDTIPYAVWLKDPDGRYLAVNALWCKTYNRRQEDVLGKTDFDFFPRETATTYWQRDEAVRQSLSPLCTEIEHTMTSGAAIWLDIRKAPVMNHEGRCVGLVGITLDITARRNAQRRLHLLHRAVEQSPTSIVITDTTGRIEYVNPYFERHTGYTQEEAAGANPRVLNSGYHPPEFFKELWATISAGNEWRGEMRNRRKNGTFYWEQASISPVRDEQGTITNFVAVKEDITARKAAELTMAWQSALVENSVDICCVKDLNLRVLTANLAMARTAGVDHPSQLVGKTDAEIFRSKENAHDARAYMEDELAVQRMKPGQVLVREERVHTADNAEHILLTRKFPVYSHEGKLIATANISTEITDLKRTERELIRAKEEAEAANRAKSTFLATMSHELRTPLNVINGMASILAQSSWPPEQQHAIEMISEGGNTLLTIIEEILDYSGLQAGKTKLDLSAFSLLTITGNALRLFSASAQAKGLNITCSVAPNTPAEVVGDPRRLQQVLVNLLQNAIKFTEHGRVHLRLSILELNENDCTVAFAIRDTGIGIAPENLRKLFQPFSQADDTITRRFGGTGLGLAISKSFINLMGGDISARSRPGRGSEFRFAVKLGTTANSGSAFAALAHPDFRGRRVLVSSKNGGQQRMLLALLRTWQMQPVLFTPSAGNVDCGHCDIAVLHPHATGNGAALPGSFPLVWLSRKNTATAGDKSRPVFFLGTSLDAVELSSAFVQLLATSSATSDKIQSATPPPQPAGPLPLSILAAEDNRTNREVIRLVLRHIGYSVDLVVNGAEAVDAVQRKKYDLLLLDVQMPVMDGISAAREICRLFPNRSQRVRMAALTANALPGDRELCLNAGMDDYLSKPILPADLLACIQRLFIQSNPSAPVSPVAVPPTTTESPWVDIPHLSTITGGGRPEQIYETLSQLYASVCSDYAATYPQISDLCERRDQKHFAETIHGLKGCFMMTGWTRAGKRCNQALAAARQGVFNEWTTFPDELQTLFKRSSSIMSAYLDSLQAQVALGNHQQAPSIVPR